MPPPRASSFGLSQGRAMEAVIKATTTHAERSAPSFRGAPSAASHQPPCVGNGMGARLVFEPEACRGLHDGRHASVPSAFLCECYETTNANCEQR
jgi:hypothetical protein